MTEKKPIVSWEDKISIVTFLNKKDFESSLKILKEKQLDCQIIDMIVMSILIVDQTIKDNLSFFDYLVSESDKINLKDLGFVSNMRLELVKTIFCDIKLNNNLNGGS